MRSREYSCRMKKTKVEIAKIDGTEDYRQKVENRTDMETSETSTDPGHIQPDLCNRGEACAI